jgi:acyl-coenzyme A thioesterase PaaI-like protein
VTAPTAFRADIPFVNDLGVEFFAADAGRATIALQLHARHLNSWKRCIAASAIPILR